MDIFDNENEQDTTTIVDERFHTIRGKRYPRATWVLETAYAKDAYFFDWLQKNGTNADAIKDKAGAEGTRVHLGIETILDGRTIFMESYNENEWRKLVAFIEWYKTYQPVIEATERLVVHPTLRVAGRLDAVAIIDDKRYIVDWKTSNTLQESYFVQTSFYAECYAKMTKKPIDGTAIVRLGTKHKVGYEYTIRSKEEMKKDFEIFKACKTIFDYKMGDIKPNDKQYPSSLSI